MPQETNRFVKKDPCKCGWPYPGFHICVDLSTPEPPPRKYPNRASPSAFSEAHREGISEAMRARWAAVREANKPRDEAIVKRYQEPGSSYTTLSEEFGINKQTIGKIIREAAERGEVKVRPPGRTVKHGA